MSAALSKCFYWLRNRLLVVLAGKATVAINVTVIRGTVVVRGKGAFLKDCHVEGADVAFHYEGDAI